MKRVDAVWAALQFEGNDVLPEGELFLERDFLDRFFAGAPGGYFGQIAAAARSLGLSLVGVDPDATCGTPQGDPMSLRDYFVVYRLNGPFGRLVASVGFIKAASSVRRDESLSRNAASAFLEEAASAADSARAMGFHALAITDDIAGKAGLLFSPAYFTDTLLPVYGRAARIAHDAGLAAFFHSDGDTRRLIGPLANAGYDAIHPVDSQAGLDVHDLAREFVRPTCFMGHIDIMAWTEEQIRLEVERAEASCRAGGLILGSSCGISTAVPYSRIRALYPGLDEMEGG